MQNGVTTEYIYDALGDTTTMTYDAQGNITELVSPQGGRLKFSYDTKGNPGGNK